MPAIKISLLKLHRSSWFTFINPRWAHTQIQPLLIIGKVMAQKKNTDFFVSQTTTVTCNGAAVLAITCRLSHFLLNISHILLFFNVVKAVHAGQVLFSHYFLV